MWLSASPNYIQLCLRVRFAGTHANTTSHVPKRWAVGDHAPVNNVPHFLIKDDSRTSGEKTGGHNVKSESDYRLHQTAKMGEGRWGINLQQSKHSSASPLRWYLHTLMRHMSEDLAGLFTTTLVAVTARPSSNWNVQLRGEKTEKSLRVLFCLWLDGSGTKWLTCLAGALVSSAPTVWQRACRPTWTPRASRHSASPCRHRIRVSSSAAPSNDTHLSPSLRASTQSAIAPSTHRGSGPTERWVWSLIKATRSVFQCFHLMLSTKRNLL